MDKYDFDNFDYDRYAQRRPNGNRNVNRKRTHKKRTRNRIIIVSVFVLLIILIFSLITSCSNWLCGKSGKKGAAAEETVASMAAATEAPVPTTSPAAVFNKPNIKDNGSSVGVNEGGLYVWDKKAFELFYGTESMAENYAELMNTAADSLGSSIKTYSIIVPNHIEFGLPDRLKNTDNGASTQPQDVYVKAGYDAMAQNVIPVNAYNKLSEHCNEYIYFNSDHHWTGLGAYYAYTAFAETANLPVLQLSQCTEAKIEGFDGTLADMVSSEIDKDTVSYWKLPYEVSNSITDSNGNTMEVNGPYYEDASPGDFTYSVFLYGDNPIEVMKSQSTAANGEKVAVIHESYGNAFVPYLTYNFSEVYSIDFRSWNGSLKQFCQENSISNVIFINGVMSSATQIQLDSIQAIL